MVRRRVTIGVGIGIVDVLQPGAAGGAIPQVNRVAAAIGESAVLNHDSIVLIRVVGINKAIIDAGVVNISTLENTVVNGDVICPAPDLN